MHPVHRYGPLLPGDRGTSLRTACPRVSWYIATDRLSQRIVVHRYGSLIAGDRGTSLRTACRRGRYIATDCLSQGTVHRYGSLVPVWSMVEPIITGLNCRRPERSGHWQRRAWCLVTGTSAPALGAQVLLRHQAVTSAQGARVFSSPTVTLAPVANVTQTLSMCVLVFEVGRVGSIVTQFK